MSKTAFNLEKIKSFFGENPTFWGCVLLVITILLLGYASDWYLQRAENLFN